MVYLNLTISISLNVNESKWPSWTADIIRMVKTPDSAI